MDPADLVAIRTFRLAAEAEIAKSILEEAEIDAMIRADNAGGMYPALGDVELLVRAEDVAKARDVLGRDED